MSPVTHFLTYNTGDFGNGIQIASVADLFLRFLPQISPEKRTTISSLIGILAIGIAEIPKYPELLHKVIGTQDIADIPAGIAGVGLYALTAVLLSKRAQRKALSLQE